jgi:hypothetical protein
MAWHSPSCPSGQGVRPCLSVYVCLLPVLPVQDELLEILSETKVRALGRPLSCCCPEGVRCGFEACGTAYTTWALQPLPPHTSPAQQPLFPRAGPHARAALPAQDL